MPRNGSAGSDEQGRAKFNETYNITFRTYPPFSLVNVMILTNIYAYEYILPPLPDPRPFQRYSLNTKKENCHSRTSYHLGICIWRTPCHTITNPLLLLVVAGPHRVVLKQVIFCLYFIKGSHVKELNYAHIMFYFRNNTYKCTLLVLSCSMTYQIDNNCRCHSFQLKSIPIQARDTFWPNKV